MGIVHHSGSMGGSGAQGKTQGVIPWHGHESVARIPPVAGTPTRRARSNGIAPLLDFNQATHHKLSFPIDIHIVSGSRWGAPNATDVGVGRNSGNVELVCCLILNSNLALGHVGHS